MAENLTSAQQSRLLSHYFLFTYLIVLLIAMDSVAFEAAYQQGWGEFSFLVAAFLSYGAIYLLPALLLTKLSYWLSNLRRKHTGKTTLVIASLVAIITSGLTLLLLYANATVFSLYGMFINGFIINLVMTPGGIQSLGGSSSSDLGFALIAAGFFALQAAVMLAVKFLYVKTTHKQILPRGIYAYTIIAFVLGNIAVHVSYAANDAFGKNTLVSLTESIPFFQHVTARHAFAKLGYKIQSGPKLEVKGRLRYPLNPLTTEKPAKPYNIIWLTSESWRADMLDPEIMPATWDFASRAKRYTYNISGGNGTRMGVFSMFTGIPGNYWFQFLKEQRGAAIIDVLKQQDYQMQLYTSARFSYPEFDKTIFSKVAPDKLHSLDDGRPGWQRDRSNVSKMLEFIDSRDPNKPFFSFMFFESPHARYFFPEESVIRRPYHDDINYATLSKTALKEDIVGIKNRYINAVHHLDSQFARIFEHLKEKQLLDNTVVILVGDHGEEFMEHGFWGHNSTFVDQQIRTPLVIWIPGQAPQVVDDMTSHMDIVPTIMPLLGITNPASDYSLGINLLSGEKRSHTYVSDWSRITYIDHQVKITQPISIQGYVGNRVTAANDEPLPVQNAAEIMKKKQDVLLHVVNDLGVFLDKKGKKAN